MNDLFEKLTPEQRSAVFTDGKNLLLSAAAGSGKTGTLTCRVIRKLLGDNPVDADRLLIATFTRAAASEMKGRIMKRLSAEASPLAVRQRVLIQAAHIGTIDSYCLWLVNQYGSVLGLPMNITLAQESVVSELERSVLSEVLEDEFEQASGDFRLLCDLALERDTAKLSNLILSFYGFLQTQPSPEAWLKKMLAKHGSDDPYLADVIREYTELLNKNAVRLERAADEADALGGKKLAASCLEISQLLRQAGQMQDGTYAAAYRSSLTLSDINIRGGETREELKDVKSIRKLARDGVAKFCGDFFTETPDEYEKHRADQEAICRCLVGILTKLDARLAGEKSEREVFGFADICRFAAQLLLETDSDGNCTPTELATRLSGDYDEVMIDEFQDINLIQYNIFKALSNGKNLFTVGDIKQSIYRFRNSDPSIFSDVEQTCVPVGNCPDGGNAGVFLNRNFRSDPGVTEAANYVFSTLMSGGETEIVYDGNQRLVCANPDSFKPEGGLELYLIPDDSGASEAEAIASRITQLMKQEIYTPDGARKAKFSDFCVLCSTNDYAIELAEQLNAVGIRSSCADKKDFFRRDEVNALLCALWAADNPMNDMALLSGLMSPVWGFTPDDMGKIRSANTRKSLYSDIVSASGGEGAAAQRCRKFLADLEAIRACAAVLPLGELVSCAAEITGYDAVAAAVAGPSATASIARLIRYASDEGARGRTLSDFVHIINASIENGGKSDGGGGDISADSVSVMTRYKSKGLEFPVVLLAQMNSTHRGGSTVGKEKICFDSDFGIATRIPVLDGIANVKTLAYNSVSHYSDMKKRAEQLRLLYVMLTRARHKTIICLTQKSGAFLPSSVVKQLSGAFVPETFRIGTSMAVWLIAAALSRPECGELRDLIGVPDFITHPTEKKWSVVTYAPSDETYVAEKSAVAAEPDPGLVRRLSENLGYSYAYKKLTVRSAKYTVTELAKPHGAPELAEPVFAAGVKGSTYGTELHSFMQLCDFEKAAAGAKAHAEELFAQGHISSEAIRLLNFQAIDRFFASPLYARLHSCKEILREFDFISRVPLAAVDPDCPEYTDELVLLQGCADCIGVRDDGLILVDYKTDALKEPAQFVERYAKQLTLYAESLEKIFSKPVLEKVIYSFRLSAEIKI